MGVSNDVAGTIPEGAWEWGCQTMSLALFQRGHGNGGVKRCRSLPAALDPTVQALRVEVGRDVADLRLGRGAIALTWLKATVVARVLRS